VASEGVERILQRVSNVHISGKGWTARCPGHDDQTNSLSIGEGKDGRALLKCHAGCATEAVMNSLGLKIQDLFPDVTAKASKPIIAATYDYKDDRGHLLYQVVRYVPKTFRQRRPDGTGEWIWNLKGVARVLYRLPELTAAGHDQPVFVVEGEKDADGLAKVGLQATTNPGGAGKWRPEFNEHLRGRHIVILPDNDEPGRAHAQTVAASLHGVAASINILPLPDLPPKGDISDWLDAGGTAETLLALVANQPAWAPPENHQEKSAAVTDEKSSQADTLVDRVEEQGIELFHDPTGSSWARIAVGDHREIWRCESKTFKQWLARLVWTTDRKVLDPHAINAALNVLAAKARFDAPELTLHNRVALHDGAFWYDLADPAWRAVRVTPNGWDVIQAPPILFRRWSHQRPQADPVRGGDPRGLLDFINVREAQQQLMLEVYPISCLVPEIAHVAPIVHGPQGATKTTFLRVMRRLIDPSITETLSLPHDKEQLIQQLAHHWAPYYDNLTGMHDWISDALCRAITGEGSSKREHYTNDEDIIYSFRVCLGFNGINVAAHKPDLLDRALLIGLEEIPRAGRRPEAQFWDAFEQARPGIFGGMLDALARAMRLRPAVQVANLPRMADFTLWGCAIAEALGHSQADFLNAYHANLMVRNEEVTAANPVAAMMLIFMDGRETWSGSASELLTELDSLAQTHRVDTRSRSWPKAAHILSRRLNEIRPNLAAAGIQVAKDRDGRGRQLTFHKTSESSVSSVTSDVKPDQSGVLGDATRESGKVASPLGRLADGPRDASDATDATFRPCGEVGPRMGGIPDGVDR
jgi:hypothetical protein